MSFNIAQFSSVFKNNHGGQPTTLFTVDIPMPIGLSAISAVTGGTFSSTVTNLKFYCTASNLPGMQFATAPVRRYGYGPVEEKPSVPIFAPIDLQFLADGKGAIWSFFYAWKNFIVNFDARRGMTGATGIQYSGSLAQSSVRGGAMPYELAYKRDYVVDVTITLYSPTGESTMSIVLRDAFPKFLGDVSLNWGDFNNLARIPVQFAYTDWYNLSIGGQSALSLSDLLATQGSLNNVNQNVADAQSKTDAYIQGLMSSGMVLPT